MENRGAPVSEEMQGLQEPQEVQGLMGDQERRDDQDRKVRWVSMVRGVLKVLGVLWVTRGLTDLKEARRLCSCLETLVMLENPDLQVSLVLKERRGSRGLRAPTASTVTQATAGAKDPLETLAEMEREEILVSMVTPVTKEKWGCQVLKVRKVP